MDLVNDAIEIVRTAITDSRSDIRCSGLEALMDIVARQSDLTDVSRGILQTIANDGDKNVGHKALGAWNQIEIIETERRVRLQNATRRKHGGNRLPETHHYV